MKTGASRSASKLIFLAIFAVVWLYIWLRAWFVQFSIDEAATFFMYVQTGRFLPPNAVVDANNHLLNSFLTWCAFNIFGPHPVALRLPNILAALVYFYFTWKISATFSKKWIQWIGVIIFSGIHFILEFFSYARGYGLSMAFLMGSVYYTLQLIHEVKFSSAMKAFFMIVLSVLANFNLIFTGLSLISIITGLLWHKRKLFDRNEKIGIVVSSFFIVIPAFAYIIFASFNIRSHDGFYYGSSDGFAAVTLKSLARMISGEFWQTFGLYAIFLSVFFIIMLVVVWARNKANYRSFMPVSILLSLLIANWAGSMILHSVWKVNFQEDRAAMHLVLLFLLWILFSVDLLSGSEKKYLWAILIPLSVIPLYSLSRLSLQSSIYGPRQQIPSSYISYIQNESRESEMPSVISAWQTRKQPWAMLNYRSGGDLNPIQSSGYPSSVADFIIIEDEMLDSVAPGYETVLRDSQTHTFLLQKSSKTRGDTIQSIHIKEIVDDQNNYKELLTISLQGDTLNNLMIAMDCLIESTSFPLEAAIVVEVFDNQRNNLIYEAIDLDQLKRRWIPGQGHFKHSLVIQNIPHQAETLILYIWNKKLVPISIFDCQVTVMNLSKD